MPQLGEVLANLALQVEPALEFEGRHAVTQPLSLEAAKLLYQGHQLLDFGAIAHSGRISEFPAWPKGDSTLASIPLLFSKAAVRTSRFS